VQDFVVVVDGGQAENVVVIGLHHVGTAWPFDNSFIAWGLRRYGFKEAKLDRPS
jgi:glycogen debranching enzyme